MTNDDERGVEAPPVGRLDYLKVTVWADAIEVMAYLRMEFLERYKPDWDTPWVDMGRAKRISKRWQWAGQEIFVLEYHEADYVSVEIKGTMCLMLRDGALRVLLIDLAARWRTNVTRLDYAWDGVPFDVLTVKAAIEAGSVSTKCRLPALVDYHQDPKTGGRTVYFARHGTERFIRVYDYRGPVRLELQLGEDYARYAGVTLAGTAVEGWPQLMIGWLRNFVDFVDRSSGQRADRCPPLPWWSDFVRGVPKVAALNPAAKPERHILGQVERTLITGARMLDAVRRAFVPLGIDANDLDVALPEAYVKWLHRKIAGYAARNWGPADDARVRTLRVWRGDRVLGWEPEAACDVPF